MSEAENFCLRGVHVLDERGGFEGPMDVTVSHGVIEAVGERVRKDEYLDVEQFEGLWLMPGVFDCHAHLACFADDTLRYMQMPVTRWTLEVAANARRLAEMGITSVRDPGGADAGIRDGIEAGLVPGPRLQVSITCLSQTGGHADGFLPGPGLEMDSGFLGSDYLGRPPFVADGVEGVRLAVRKVLRGGADWIKICTTGGLLSAGLDHPDEPEFSSDEIAMIVSEARRKKKPVMAHAYGGEGLTEAVNAGVRSIEHGLRLTEEQASLMAAEGCWLVPTLSVMYELAAGAKEGEFEPRVTRKVQEIEPILGDAVAVAHDAGVRIAMGTDLIIQRANLQEIVLMKHSGLSAAEAILAATSEAAELCGVGDRLGRITPGYEFDAIVLDQDPSDLEVFRGERPAVAVFQRGRITHERRSVTAL